MKPIIMQTPEEEQEWGFQRVEPIEEQKKEGMGFFKSIGKGALRSTDIIPIAEGTYDTFFGENYLNDEKPEDWTPLEWGNLKDIPEKHWDSVLRANSPRELQDIRQTIFDEMAADEEFANGNVLGGFIGNAIGGIASISSLIPISATLKYASISKGIFNNMLKQAPGVALSSALTNAAIINHSETKHIDDWARDTFVETVVGSTIFGGVGAFIAGRNQVTKNILKEKWAGMDFQPIAKENGEFGGWKVKQEPGSNVSAMRVKEVQNLLDDGIAKYGENKLFKKMFYMTPITRGLTSNFETVRNWTNSIFSHNIITGAIEKGYGQIADAESISRFWGNQSLKIEQDIGTIWAESIGVRGPLKDAQAHFKENAMTRTAFEEALFDPMFNGGRVLDPNVPKSMVPHIEKAAEVVRKHYDKLYEEMVRMKVLDPNVTSVTDLSYINRVYNKMKMQDLGPEHFISNLMPAIQKQQAEIRSIEKPLKDINQQIGNLRERLSEIGRIKLETTGANFKKQQTLEDGVRKELSKLNRDAKIIKNDIQTRIDEGKISIELLDEIPTLAPKELKQLKELRKDYIGEKNVIVKDINNSRRSINKLQKEYKAYKKEETFIKLNEEKEKLKTLKENLFNFENTHQRMLREKKIPEELLNIGDIRNPNLRLKNPKERWLRSTISDEDIPDMLRASYDTILQESPEQMVARMGKSIMRGGSNPIKSRAFLFGTEYLKPYLETNVVNLMKTHTNYMGKFLGMEESMRYHGTSIKDGLEEIYKRLNKEFDNKRESVLYDIKGEKGEGRTLTERPKTKERDKKLRDLQEQYNTAKDFIDTSYSIYWGDYNPAMVGGKTGENINRGLQALKNYSVSTMLGALPFLQLPEIFANFMRHSFGPIIENGLVPLLSSPSFRAMARRDAADAGLGFNVSLNAQSNQLWGNGMYYQPQTGVERMASNLASWLGNVTGSNFIQDMNQTISAEISKSSLIRILKKHVSGEALTRKETEKLGLMRIDPNVWAKRIVNQFEKHGEAVNFGKAESYKANYQNWDDFKASQTFLMGVNKEVSSIILTPNLLDIPFAFRNPFVSSMMQFMSYGFSATNSFLIPTLQRPDANKVIAILGMGMVGSMVGPLRQLASGQEVNLDPAQLAVEAIANSGVLGIFADFVLKMNAAFDLPLLSEYRNDRYRNKDALDLLGGPLGGILNSAQRIGNMFLSGQINESDMRRFKGLLPLANTWYLRYIGNKSVEAMELPKTKGDAQRWFE